jgi:hypothetical protein
MSELIGLSGYAGAGKDEVARILRPYGWQRASFADPLRAALYALDPSVEDVRDNIFDGVSLQEIVDEYGWDKVKRDFPEVRQLLQRMGTEVGRNLFGQDFWVDQAMHSLEEGGKYVFTDCRFPNEADAIRARGGRVFRVWRPDVTAVNGHPSETALDDYDFDGVIANDQSLPLLPSKVTKAVGLR